MKKMQFCVTILILLVVVPVSMAAAQVIFTDVAEAAGLDIRADLTAFGDYDNDGDADMIFSSDWSGNKRVYRNEGNGMFLDVTETTGLDLRSGNGTIFLDFDNDGNLDLFTSGTNSDHGDLLHWNKGDGTFVDVSLAGGMKSESRRNVVFFAMDAISLDYDDDGLLDIFVSNFLITSPLPNFVYHNEGNGSFAEIAAEIGFDEVAFAGITPGDYDNDGDLDLFIAGPGNPTFGTPPDLEQGTDMLYRNEGGGVYTDVALQAKVQRKSNHISGLFWDYDNDGYMDLFVRGLHRADIDGFNILYRNNRDGTFTEVTQQAGIAQVKQYTAGVHYGDYDNDGWLDLCIAHQLGQSGTLPVLLYHNNRDGTFTDVTRQEGIRTMMEISIYSLGGTLPFIGTMEQQITG